MTAAPHGERPKGLLAFMSTAVVLGLIALGLSVQNAVNLGRESDQREAERVAADVAGCDRGNTLRGQVVTVGDANEDLVRGIVDVVLPPDATNGDRAKRIAEIRAQIEPLFDRHREAVDQIEPVDCEAVTPGATSTSLPGENP